MSLNAPNDANSHDPNGNSLAYFVFHIRRGWCLPFSECVVLFLFFLTATIVPSIIMLSHRYFALSVCLHTCIHFILFSFHAKKEVFRCFCFFCFVLLLDRYFIMWIHTTLLNALIFNKLILFFYCLLVNVYVYMNIYPVVHISIFSASLTTLFLRIPRHKPYRYEFVLIIYDICMFVIATDLNLW